MDGKGDTAGADVEALKRDLHRRMVEMIGAPLEEMERTARAIAIIAKAVDGLADLTPRNDNGSRDEGLNAEDEQRLRDQFLARLDAVATALELEGVDRCPACGRFEPDRARLEELARSGAEAAGG